MAVQSRSVSSRGVQKRTRCSPRREVSNLQFQIFSQLLLCHSLTHTRDSHYFVSAGFTAGYGNGGARNCKQLSKEFNHRLVGFAVDRRRGDCKLECVAYHAGDGVLASAGMNLYGKCDSFHGFMDGNHAGFGRSPKIADPTRTQLDPSSMATSKSCDMPMESTSIWTPGSLRAAILSRRSRSRRKYGRAASGASVNGGTVISPRICRFATFGAARSRLSNSGESSGMPALLSSSPTFISIRTSSFLFDSAAAWFSFSASRRESTESTALNNSAAFFALLICRWPIRCHWASLSPLSA